MDINIIIDNVRTRIKEITKHFPYTEFEIDMLTICYIAIASIDNDITDILDEVLGRDFILFNDASFNSILEELDIPSNIGSLYALVRFAFLKRSYYEFININTKDSDFNDIFCSLVHELKHAINTTLNIVKRTTKVPYFYSGLSRYKYRSITPNFNYLDEAFNCFMTTIYLQEIAKLKDLPIKDSNIRSILNEFTYIKGYTYDSAILLERVFQDSDVFKLFYNATIYHDFKSLYEKLTSIFALEGESIEEKVKYLEHLLKLYEDSGDYEIFVFLKNESKDYPKRELQIKSYYENI